jgi:hypothetical protein
MFCSLMSPGSALTSQIGVLASGEDEVNGFRLQILLSMIAPEKGQLWYGRRPLGWMNRPGSAKKRHFDRSEIHIRHLTQHGLVVLCSCRRSVDSNGR